MTFVSTVMMSLPYYQPWKALYRYSSGRMMPWQELVTYVMIGQAINIARFRRRIEPRYT